MAILALHPLIHSAKFFNFSAANVANLATLEALNEKLLTYSKLISTKNVI